MIDHEAMRRNARDLYVRAIHDAYGGEGMDALRVVMDSLVSLFERLELEQLNAPLVVIHSLSGFDEAVLPTNSRAAPDIPSLVPMVRGPCVIRIHGRGFECWPNRTVDPSIISTRAVVYCHDGSAERFVVKGADCPLPVFDTAQASIFARPTFGDLRDALQNYRRRIRTSACSLFKNAWDDDNRLFFRSHAEREMRRSLHQYLDTVLRDAEVRPEQNVDESHPIDIKVTWTFATRIALIEIKWIGKSRDAGRITANHSNARANDGARQLADYLDKNRSFVPDHVTMGYLVVVDGRRRGLKPESTSVTRRNGFHYDSLEIKFDPEYHKARIDFEEPIRLFCEPICAQI